MNPVVSQSILGIYAVLLVVGGVIGFTKAGSRPSLLAGLTSGLLAAVCAFLVGFDRLLGLWLGAGLAAALLAYFGPKFARTRKVMPAGMMALVSLLVLVFLAVQAMQGRA